MTITSHERVLRACRFERPDRIPRVDSFGDVGRAWEQRLGRRQSLCDVAI